LNLADWIPLVTATLTLIFVWVLGPTVAARLNQRRSRSDARGQDILNEGSIWELYQKVLARMDVLELRVDELEKYARDAERALDTRDRVIAVLPEEYQPARPLPRPHMPKGGSG
jgi:hypothetical protein